MKILNFGSLNIDHVYQVDHISRPGETLASSSYQVFAGGKGANQSAALARAGAPVFHAGQVGPEAQWLVEKLATLGADMQFTQTSQTPTGHAIIQVDPSGENSIVLYPGCNKEITTAQIDATLDHFTTGDILLLQNEINNITYLIKQANKKALRICLNPAPFDSEILTYPLDLVDILVVNQTEGMGLCPNTPLDRLADQLAATYAKADIVLTLGAKGAIYRSSTDALEIPAQEVSALDTTAAGDTFIGYFLAAVLADLPTIDCLEQASKAAALCVTRAGAMDSIPAKDELD